MYIEPLGYFITIRTYGTWLHGDERGSVDRLHNEFGAPRLPENERLRRFMEAELVHEPVVLTDAQRAVADAAMRGVCEHKQWVLHALNVRTNHAHFVVTAPGLLPEPVMNSMKAWATRLLREAGLASLDQHVWGRHGSTIYLFRPENMAGKIRYVLEGQ